MIFRRRPKVPPSSLAEEAAGGARLKTVTRRGQGEESLYPAPKEQPKNPTSRRRFWTPDELIDDGKR